MKVSLNWIKDYVDIPDSLELSRLAYDLTMSTVEVEEVVELARRFDGIVVGEVRELLPHPNAGKLRVCVTDVGRDEAIRLVCGGTNLYAGMKTVVALPGAMVRWHGEGAPVKLAPAKVRGVESCGMICASSEVGLFDLFPFTEEGTVVDLSGLDVRVGQPLAEALGLDDVILEIDNKSLTNRPDLWGHYGIAREISALYGLPLKPPETYSPPAVPSLPIRIDDTARCARYIGAKLEGLCVKPAPFAMQSRIWRVGMRPANAIVDVTNYVMLATGQPMHAFDFDHVRGGVTVRRAAAGETLLLLGGKALSLSAEDLVIADDAGALALAGVMGGEKDSVLPETARVLLEVASFDALGVRRTAARHETRTEAAARFEKAIDPQRCDAALAMAMRLFRECYPELRLTAFCDNYPKPLPEKTVEVSLAWLEKRLGKTLARDDVAAKLERLGFTVAFDGDDMRVDVPSWRATGDVSIPNDIMEEVARLYGFAHFEAAPITTTFTAAINQPEIDLERRVKEYLAFRCGMQEIFTYPWMSDEYVDALLPGAEHVLALSTPPSPTERRLRFSLVPNLCKAVCGNLRYFDEFAVFEAAQILQNRAYTTPYDAREALPLQRGNAAGAFVGAAEAAGLLFRRAKGVLELLPRYVHIEPYTFERGEKPPWADDAAWLNLVYGGERVGNLALLSKKAALACGIKNGTAALFELDLDALKPYPSRTNSFTRLPEYPMTEYDVSLLVGLSTRWEEVRAVVLEGVTPDGLLRDVAFVDEYRGRQVPEGKKSVTLRLTIGSLTKTLTSREIEDCANAVIKRLGKALAAELRG